MAACNPSTLTVVASRDHPRRLHELDALRGLAALGVVLWHYGSHFQTHPFFWLGAPFYNAGFLLVDFFFVLSGFVLGAAYWRPGRQDTPRRNILLRIARLYPLHLVMLVITAALLYCLRDAAVPASFELGTNDAYHFVLNLLLLNQSGLQQDWSFNTPAWSISSEFIVNVAFLMFIAFRWPMRVGACVMGIAAVVLAWRWQGAPLVGPKLLMGSIDLNLARCVIGFCAGVMLHLALNRFGGRALLSRWRNTMAVAGPLSLAALVGFMLFSRRHPPNWHYLASVAIATACVALVPFSSPLNRWLSWRPLVILGEISYSVYLVHYPLQLILLLVIAHTAINPASHVTFLTYLTTTVALAWLTYTIVERPSLAFLQARVKRGQATT